MHNILFMHLDNLCIKLMLIIGFSSQKKKFKAYYGFRVLYVFPFHSAGHGPIGLGRDTCFLFLLFGFSDFDASFGVIN